MIIKKHQPPFRNFEQVAFVSIGSHDFQEWTATYQWSLTIHFFLLTLWFFNSSLWKPGPIKKSMMKMMIYRTYPLVNYTIDPEHQQFFVETNLPTHQVRRLLRNPRISMEAFFWIYGWLSIAMLDCRRVKELFRLVEWSLETPWILLPFHS